MNKIPDSIPKQPQLKAAEDYYRLRREGIGHLEDMGSALWTDYNSHDPGITILESLCYAITDVGYRSGWDIQDLLAPAPGSAGSKQAFFTAAAILTVNPVTTDDFRRLLIDLDGIRNAWVMVRQCVCAASYYAWCEPVAGLRLAYQANTDPQINVKTVSPKGLYDVLLELEADPELGDLNDRVISQSYSEFDSDGVAHPVILELHFPDWRLANLALWQRFINPDTVVDSSKVTRFGANKIDNALDLLTEDEHDQYLRSHWRSVFYLTIECALAASTEKITITNISLRISGDITAKAQTSLASLLLRFQDPGNPGFIARYRSKLHKAQAFLVSATELLQQHRNLDEDYCTVKLVAIEEVSVCADIEVKADADIEKVQAQVWLAIENYLNPPVLFYSLSELLTAEVPVEAIFNGPELSNGFLKADELNASQLTTVLRGSDIINALMAIDGIIAVNNLLLSKYDAEGNQIKGAADPSWQNGKPVFDVNKTSAAWLLFITAMHQPRFLKSWSRFLFLKNGLPFLPRADEANDTLMQLHGLAERPKLKASDNDLPVPTGNYRNPEDYFPLQYGFPLAYGIGPEGLPAQASTQRKAQASQLKAYLMVFEQLLVNALAQIGHCGDLFALDPVLRRTYFVKPLLESVLAGVDDILLKAINEVDASGKTPLAAMAESEPEFRERRNRFLDHVMARFGEQFSEYALLLANFDGQQLAQDRLIANKISFLQAYPSISHNRGKAFNYRTNPCVPDNFSGLKKRLSLLLGYPNLNYCWLIEVQAGKLFLTLQLTDLNGNIGFYGQRIAAAADLFGYFLPAATPDLSLIYVIVQQDGQLQLQARATDGTVLDSYPLLAAKAAAGQVLVEQLRAVSDKVLRQMTQADAYKISATALQLYAADGVSLLGQSPVNTDAAAVKAELLSWSANERALVIEHLLLRPKFPGDALFPACSEAACMTCGDEDPYSFRLTVVMPGWTAPYNDNMELRRFAERSWQQEIPAHLVGKICWLANDGFGENLCDPLITQTAELLVNEGLTAAGIKPDFNKEACPCALEIYKAFNKAFSIWYADKTLTVIAAEQLKTLLAAEFSMLAMPTCGTVLTAGLWSEIQQRMLLYFQAIALNGWQFERLEDAWRLWLTANAKIDWTAVQLHEQVAAILQMAATAPVTDAQLCACSNNILTNYASQYFTWMQGNIANSKQLQDFGAPPAPVLTGCDSALLSAEAQEKITTLLVGRDENAKHLPGYYDSWVEVSYRLWIVLTLLSRIRNIYPGATLHDCDDGSDQNPVRLGSTALGSLPADFSPP